jgi:hypothetical protein
VVVVVVTGVPFAVMLEVDAVAGPARTVSAPTHARSSVGRRSRRLPAACRTEWSMVKALRKGAANAR